MMSISQKVLSLMSRSRRISVPSLVVDYLESYGTAELGTDDLQVVLTVVIGDHMRGLCSCRGRTAAGSADDTKSSQS